MRFKNPINKKNNPLGSYSRYSGMAIQMVLVILAGSFGGLQIDKWLDWRFPVFTVLLSLGAVTLSIWLLIKEFNSNDKTNES